MVLVRSAPPLGARRKTLCIEKVWKLGKEIIWLHVCVLSCVQIFVTPWTVACQAPLSMRSS